MKERIKNVMNYRRPAFWITVVAAVMCVILAVALLTNPKQESIPPTTEESVEDEWELAEKEISVFYGDLTGDEVEERIVLSIDVFPEYMEETDLVELLNAGFLARVSVYKGLGENSYEEEYIWNFTDISTSRPGNYQLSLIERNGDDYLLISTIHEQQGTANYQYEVLSLTESGEEVVQDEYEISFKTALASQEAEGQISDMPIRSDVLPDFVERLNKWYDETGILIIATDLNLWEEDIQGVLYSHDDVLIWYMTYYDKIFARQDYYTLQGKTMYETTYFTFELPEEWAGKIHYEESENGKCVWIYHTKTSELMPGGGLLGSIFLETQEQALETMKMIPARYIGGPYKAENGEIYMPMACGPTDVQFVSETAEEFLEMSAYFSDIRMARYVWVTENGMADSALWSLAFSEEQYPQYGLQGARAAVAGQKLPWQGYSEDYVLFDSDGDNHTLIINDKDYSAMVENAFHLSDSNVNTWYAVADLDINDESQEILVFDEGPSDDPVLHVIRITDDKAVYLGGLGTLSFTGAFRYPGDGTITVLEQTWIPENNAVEKSYRINNRAFEEIPREEYSFIRRDYHSLMQDLEVYKERDISSDKVILKAEDVQICINKVFPSSEEERFYEIETKEGEIYYLYSDGWLDDYVADLIHAG